MQVKVFQKLHHSIEWIRLRDLLKRTVLILVLPGLIPFTQKPAVIICIADRTFSTMLRLLLHILNYYLHVFFSSLPEKCHKPGIQSR
jgi:hypothetical protein